MTVPRPGSGPAGARLLAGGAAALYLAAVAADVLGPWALGALAVLLAAVAAMLLARGPERPEGALAAWPPLHLFLLLTGSLDSPLLPLAAGWVVLVARRAPRLALPAAVVAAALVPAVQWVRHAPPLTAGAAVRYAILLALGVAAARWIPARAARPAATRGDEEEGRPAPAAPREGPGGDDEVLAGALELVRRATDAHEAALWRRDADLRTATRIGWAAAPGAPEAAAVVELEGHPFAWAILEQMPVHLQRGKRDLPSAWAAEMLLVPVDVPDGVLALAYPGVTPPGVEPTALEAGRSLAALLSLLAQRRDAAREEARIGALHEAVRVLPGELEMDAFARKLAEVVRTGMGAEGTAVVLGPGDTTPGRILAVATGEGKEPRLPPALGEEDSRLALAMKHGVELSYTDLRRERDRLPLFGPREQWDPAPRSAAFLPLAVDGRTLGAVVAWDPAPGRFGEREMDLLRRIGTVAPLPLRSATRYEEVERKASTDALTGLANRDTFETRFAAQSGYFDRYARPFSVVILDVDHFKRFNDTWGHEAGDRVLKHVADLLRNTVRELDLPARLGGEEFVVLLPETGLRPAAEVAERIRRAIEVRSVVWNGRPLSVTVSLGVAACPDCVATPGELLAAADAALYRSKGAGRNRVSMAPRANAPAEPGTPPGPAGVPGAPPGR